MHTADPLFQNDLTRRIVHVDMDAFYASVEQRDRPELRDKPIAVGHADRRGVVATASYEARPYGVHSAMPSSKAKMLCPHLIFVEGRMSRYREVSAEIRAIFHRYTDLVEPISIDEAYLDVTDNKLGIETGTEVARRIKADILRETSLTASAGVSYNKFLAKIASDFWGVGPATAKRFRGIGVTNGWELRQLSFRRLTDQFGAAGSIFYKFARGIDLRPVRPFRERKSVGCEETFADDLKHPDRLAAALYEIAVELEKRRDKNGFIGRTLTLKIRFADFTTKTKSRTDLMPFVGAERLAAAGLELLRAIEVPAAGVRLLGLSVSGDGGSAAAAREETLFAEFEKNEA